jgi:dihydroorotase
LAELFEKHDKLDNLEKFVSLNAQEVYNFKPVEKTITLVKKPYVVPESYDGFDETVVPMHAGQTLAWSLEA